MHLDLKKNISFSDLIRFIKYTATFYSVKRIMNLFYLDLDEKNQDP